MTIPINSKKIQCQIVTHNDGATIEECLDSILVSKFTDLIASFVILDNCSTDGSIERIEKKFGRDIEIIKLEENLGFAGGHNFGVTYAVERGCDYIAILNPDLLLEEDCIENLTSSLNSNRKIGISSPKLYRTTKEFKKDTSSIDAAGMYFTKALRHLDRTEDFDDFKVTVSDKFNSQQYAIGGSGACFVISRECVEAVSFPVGILDSEHSYLFDPDFFVYREDAELALRMQWLSWKTIYVPKAIGYHKRFVRPDNRKLIPTRFNRMSVRNRFLFQGNDISLGLFILTFPYSWIRNILVIIGCLTKERTSLAGLTEAFNLRHRTLKKRNYIFKNASTSVFSFFSFFNKVFAFPPALEKVIPPKNKNSLDVTKITVVVINYYQGAELLECYHSLKKSNLENVKLSINFVNNSPDDSDFLHFKESTISPNEKLPSNNNIEVEIIEPGQNLGFSGAINHVCSGNESDYFLILNPDIVLDENAIVSNLKHFRLYSNLAAVSPILIDKQTNEPQINYSVKRLPRLITLCAEFPGIKSIFANNPIFKFQHYLDSQEIMDGFLNRTGCFEVEQLAGACLMIKNSAFKKVHGFNEEFYPAWQEDVDFCFKLYKEGLVSAINCDAKAFHIGGTSTTSLDRSDFLYIYYKNYLKLWVRHHEGLTTLSGKILISLTFFIKGLANLKIKDFLANLRKIIKLMYSLWKSV